MARRPFRTPDARIVVSTGGYFDVFPLADQAERQKPAYRGVVAELGMTMRGPGERLGVRPDSAALGHAVLAWSERHGAAAVRGDLGPGRDGSGEAAPATTKAA